MSRPTSAQRRHRDAVAALGCIVDGCMAPAEIHHITGAGMGLKSPEDAILPLCYRHHNGGEYGIAIHSGTETWEKLYGTQAELLALVRERLQVAA